MKLVIKVGLILIAVFYISSCYVSNEEDLFINFNCNTEAVSFEREIRPILANNCLVCHSAAANLGNITLQTHEDIIPYIQDGSLLGSIRHDAGFAPMPENSSRINSCSISQIESWIEAGAPNN